jgi:hypothetical protein
MSISYRKWRCKNGFRPKQKHDGISKVVHHWAKGIEKHGDYVEKICTAAV